MECTWPPLDFLNNETYSEKHIEYIYLNVLIVSLTLCESALAWPVPGLGVCSTSVIPVEDSITTVFYECCDSNSKS